ncbi:MAG: hypothetical protein JNK49_02440 [Planctomycetes bacterium]|nr:hypothetical protein [Planctomycetota bacterium]
MFAMTLHKARPETIPMRSTSAFSFFVFSTVVGAQGAPLAPTGSITIDASATMGQLAYSRIDIPAGVTVTFSGSHPIQIRCTGSANIVGEISVAANGARSGPGAVSTGSGSSGVLYTSFLCGGSSQAASSGRHAGVYGSTFPFSLEGGSPGGHCFVYGQGDPFTPCTFLYAYFGGGGGGTLVLDADGVIDVSGTVNANGGAGSFYSGSGSGGSILLRGRSGLIVRGTVQARPGFAWPGSPPGPEHGYIRLDAYGQVPVVLGVLDPPAHVMRLPLLVEQEEPRLGMPWRLQVAAPAGDGVFLAAAFQPGSFTGPYGQVGIDLYNAITFAFLTMPVGTHDPIATFQMTMPANTAFAGVQIWTAGLDYFTAQQPRYTNTVFSVLR